MNLPTKAQLFGSLTSTLRKTKDIAVSGLAENIWRNPDLIKGGKRIKELLSKGFNVARETGNIGFGIHNIKQPRAVEVALNPGSELVTPKLKEEGVNKYAATAIGLGIDVLAPGPGEAKVAEEAVPGIFKGFKDLTTKVLERLKGHSTVPTEHIFNLTNAADLKQPERDLIRALLKDEPKTVNVQDFADKVKTELLPLKPTITTSKWEGIVLPNELRGPVADYYPRVYSSPIRTSAGDVHFTDMEFPGKESYFAHTRIEDLPDGTTRRVIEAQSDLYQKGRLEQEGGLTEAERALTPAQREKEMQSFVLDRAKSVEKLEPYRNTWHERIIREEVKQAAVDGKSLLQFPTGETAMKIEGLGQHTDWRTTIDNLDVPLDNPRSLVLSEEPLVVGRVIYRGRDNADAWVITDVLGDGKFKAVNKAVWDDNKLRGGDKVGFPNASQDDTRLTSFEGLKEQFDISGNLTGERMAREFEEAKAKYGIDSEEAKEANRLLTVFKFYEKDVSRYLKNKYGAELITDAQGVTWWQLLIKKEMAGQPIEAFGKATVGTLLGLGGAGAAFALRDKKKAPVETKPDYTHLFAQGATNTSKGVINGYSLKSYATDPKHERNISAIFRTVQNVTTPEEMQVLLDKAKTHVTAQMIFDSALKYGVDPRIMYSIMMQDSHFGTRGAAVRTKNPGNVGNTDSGARVTYATWEAGVDAVAKNLIKRKLITQK